jgi:hypothetical protein
MNPDYKKYPICDTDIWVNLCLGDLLPRLFGRYEKILFADVVEGEIMAWRKHNEFAFIADEFAVHKERQNVFVIEHHVHIEQADRVVLEGVLYDLGFRYDFKNEPPEKNKGEFVSAIYADHFGIMCMKTNDNAFQSGGQGVVEFPDLKIKNWYDVVEELVPDSREKIKLRTQVERESKRMTQQHEKLKEAKKKEDMLSKLAEKFNTRRN